MWLRLTSNEQGTELVHLSACRLIYWPATDQSPSRLDVAHAARYSQHSFYGAHADELWRHVSAGVVWPTDRPGERDQ